MGTRVNDGPLDTRIPVATVEAGEFSEADVTFGKVGRVRTRDGREKLFAGNLLLAAIKNGGELIDDPQYTPNHTWKEACALYHAANGRAVVIQFPRGIRKAYTGPHALEHLIQALAAGGVLAETNASPIRTSVNGESAGPIRVIG